MTIAVDMGRKATKTNKQNGLIHTEQITSSSLVVQLKLNCSRKKPTHDDIIEAKEVYIQQSFGRYEGKIVLRN